MAEEEILGQIHLNVAALTHFDAIVSSGDVGAAKREDYECGVHGSFSAGAADGGILTRPRLMCCRFLKHWRMKLRGGRVVVSCFCPGATNTGFQKRAGMENSRLFKKIGAMNAEAVQGMDTAG